MSKGIEIKGAIFAVDDDVDIDLHEFIDLLIDFVTAHGWQFGGITRPITDSCEDASDE